MPSWAEIDLGVIQTNARRLLDWVAPARLIAVVKANAYGHGAGPVAQTLEPLVDRFAVATPQEALDLRRLGIRKPVLLLYPLLAEELEAAIEADAEPSVESAEQIDLLAQVAQRHGRPVRVHVEVNTGMNRFGVAPEELPGLLERLGGRPELQVRGVWTHFACAEDPTEPFTWEQMDRFRRAVASVFSRPPLRHVANSAATLNFPTLALDAVRVGLALYGLYPGPNTRRSVPLEPALAWKASVVRIGSLPAGEGVSYSLRYRAERPRRVATLAVGYADGFRWSASGSGWVLLRGRRAPVVGSVCMDAVVCDVTDIPDVRVGDAATLLGTDGSERISADDLARRWNTINYEVLTGIGPRVRRIYRPPKGAN